MLWASDVDVGEGTWVKDLHCSLVPLPMLWPSTSVMGLHCARWRNPNLSCRSSHALEAVRLATPETTPRPCSWTSTPPGSCDHALRSPRLHPRQHRRPHEMMLAANARIIVQC